MRSFRTNEATANENGKKKNRNASRFYFENRFSWSSNRVVQRGKRVCNLKFILSGSEDGRGIATNAHTHSHDTQLQQFGDPLDVVVPHMFPFSAKKHKIKGKTLSSLWPVFPLHATSVRELSLVSFYMIYCGFATGFVPTQSQSGSLCVENELAK